MVEVEGKVNLPGGLCNQKQQREIKRERTSEASLLAAGSKLEVISSGVCLPPFPLLSYIPPPWRQGSTCSIVSLATAQATEQCIVWRKDKSTVLPIPSHCCLLATADKMSLGEGENPTLNTNSLSADLKLIAISNEGPEIPRDVQ